MSGPAFLHASVDLDKDVAILDEGGIRAFKHAMRHLGVIGIRIAVLEPEISGVVGVDRVMKLYEILRKASSGSGLSAPPVPARA